MNDENRIDEREEEKAEDLDNYDLRCNI